MKSLCLCICVKMPIGNKNLFTCKAIESVVECERRRERTGSHSLLFTISVWTVFVILICLFFNFIWSTFLLLPFHSPQRIIEQFDKTPARVHACSFSTDCYHHQKHTRVRVCVCGQKQLKTHTANGARREKGMERKALTVNSCMM